MGRKLNFKEKNLLLIKETRKKNAKMLSILLILIIAVTGINEAAKYMQRINGDEQQLGSAEIKGEIFRGVLVGDMMFDRYVGPIAKKRGYAEFIFKKVKPILISADYVTGNFENPVLKSSEAEKADKEIRFSTDSKSVEALKKMNFSVVNLANNHVLDYGKVGLDDTKNTFDKFNLDYVGVSESSGGYGKYFSINIVEKISAEGDSYFRLVGEDKSIRYTSDGTFTLKGGSLIHKSGMKLEILNLDSAKMVSPLKILKDGTISSPTGVAGKINVYSLMEINKLKTEDEGLKLYSYGSGTEKQSPKIQVLSNKISTAIEEKTATIGVTDIVPKDFAATGAREGVLTTRSTEYLKWIEAARKEADIVVVHVHFGEEYNTGVTERQKDIARSIADSGADIVVGHHPHVVEPFEIYKNSSGKTSVIFYSLGNFVFDQTWSDTKESVMVQYTVKKDGSCRFEIIPIWLDSSQPQIVTDEHMRFRKYKILNVLGKMMQNKYDIKEENSRLVFDVTNFQKGK